LTQMGKIQTIPSFRKAMKEKEGELLVVEIPLEMMMMRFSHQRISNSRPHQLEAEFLRCQRLLVQELQEGPRV